MLSCFLLRYCWDKKGVDFVPECFNENMPETLENKILKRIRGKKRGWVFTPRHFRDLAGASTLTTILQRLRDEGIIRQLGRGLYDFPRQDALLGVLHPSIDEIALALAGRDEARIQPAGAYAANLLGLSTQVPMQVVFLTDGSARTVRIGKQVIQLKHTTPRNMAAAGRISGLVIQALRHLGKEQVGEAQLRILAERLGEEECRQLLRDIRLAPAWIGDVIRRVCDSRCA